jgi:predicted ArsR family transcriptional regulator
MTDSRPSDAIGVDARHVDVALTDSRPKDAGPPQAVVLLASPVRRHIVEVLRAARRVPARDESAGSSAVTGMTAAQIARAVGLHVTTARFHLDQLVTAEVLITTTHRRAGAGRPCKIFALAPATPTPADDALAVTLLTELLTENFSDRRADGHPLNPDEVGFRWARRHIPCKDSPAARSIGEWVGKVGGLMDVLERWGYAPELATTNGGRVARIDLPHCPFRELAQQHTDVVCGIHRGLISGTLDRLGEPDTDVTLVPFARGSTCIAHLRRTVDFPPSEARPGEPHQAGGPT